ncbi:MAG: hypothetical protein HOP09_04840 [Hyphomicrobium sp.]|nr:hypothetical protein [Hyphomicrobium sp.]
MSTQILEKALARIRAWETDLNALSAEIEEEPGDVTEAQDRRLGELMTEAETIERQLAAIPGAEKLEHAAVFFFRTQRELGVAPAQLSALCASVATIFAPSV